MPLRSALLPRVLALLAVLVAALFAGTSVSHAATGSWGDNGHFGELESELRAPEAGFGVDPEDGSVWIADVALVPVEKGAEEELRLQKFEKVGGVWKVVASHVLEVNEAPTEALREVEGVAFDTKEHRAYVLVTEGRVKGKNEEEQVAGELWAFSTETTGGKIEPAAGTKAGVLVPRTETNLTGGPIGKKEFSPNATEKGISLFAPGGITVNPSTDQVVITGWIGGEEPVVWGISDTGEIQTVWEDKTKFFEKCGCLTSPVFTASGKLLALGSNPAEISELPANLSSATAPKQAFWLPRSGECEDKVNSKEAPCPFIEELTGIDDGAEIGGALSVDNKGNVYLHVKVRNASEGGLKTGAVMVLNPSLEEVGWTGGGVWGSATKECAVNESDPGNFGPALIAGYEGRAFMFERGNPVPDKEHAKVLELAEKGNASNCPHASASKPAAEALGKPLSSFPIADTVTLSSKVTQANALSSEWEFGDGVTQKVEKRQQQKTSVTHQFKKEGTLTVVEHINSDDLATPAIETSEKITIVAPKVKAEGATVEGASATLKAEVNPTGSPTKCEFVVAEEGEAFTGAGAKKFACPGNPGEEEKWVFESKKVEGLTIGKEYQFRLITKAGSWENSQEAGFEPGTKFKISEPGAPEVKLGTATEVGTTTATLNGTVNPEGTATKSCTFEYGTTLPSGKTAACTPTPGSGTTNVAVSAKLTGLTAATAYKVKLLDEGSTGKKGEAEGTLTTLEAASEPTVETLSAASVTQTGATLKGFVNPHGEATTCVFEYGPTTSYGTTVPCASSAGNGRSNVEESVAVSGLTPATSYHFRITATSTLGTAQGGDKELKTLEGSKPPPPPNEETHTGTTPPPGGGSGVLPHVEEKHIPNVTVAGSAASVASSGAFSLKLSCPTGETTCSGTVTVKTLTAVSASAAHAAKKAILTLASGSFSIVGGKVKVVSLHLGAKAKKLLAKVHSIRAKITIAAHDPEGGAHSTTAIVTLKLAKKKH